MLLVVRCNQVIEAYTRVDYGLLIRSQLGGLALYVKKEHFHAYQGLEGTSKVGQVNFNFYLHETFLTRAT